jgi:hypothetical protein
MKLSINRTAFVIILFSFQVALCSPSGLHGRTIYVDDDASGLNNGSSWENAYIYLQDALADANSSPKPVEIRVAQGIYTPDRGAGIEAGDYNASFELINGVTLSGGYAGLNPGLVARGSSLVARGSSLVGSSHESRVTSHETRIRGTSIFMKQFSAATY